ncbi:helix-turn-helix transcriptional regulator [Cronobacter sakazakii]
MNAGLISSGIRHCLKKTKNIVVVSPCEITGKGIYHTLQDMSKVNKIHLLKDESLINKDFIEKKHINIVVIDADLTPCMKMMSFSVRRFSKYSGISVVVVSSRNSAVEAIQFMRAGAKAYIGRPSPQEIFTDAITHVSKGKWWLAPQMKKQYLQVLYMNDREGRTPAENLFFTLTRTEQSVIWCLLNGLTISEIAKRENKSTKTVSGQKQSAMRKLGVNSTYELFKIYYEIIR